MTFATTYAGSAPAAPSRLSIAVVDDDEAFRDSLAVLLDGAGHAAVAFSDVEALLAALDGSIHAVVLDVHMPGLHGGEAVRRIADVAPGLRIVSVSGRADPGDRVAMLAAGAAAWLEKPFALEALLARLAA